MRTPVLQARLLLLCPTLSFLSPACRDKGDDERSDGGVDSGSHQGDTSDGGGSDGGGVSYMVSSAPSTGLVELRLFDAATDLGLEGVAVQVGDESLVTGADGGLSVEATTGRLSIGVVLEGYLPLDASVGVLGSNELINLGLSPAGVWTLLGSEQAVDLDGLTLEVGADAWTTGSLRASRLLAGAIGPVDQSWGLYDIDEARAMREVVVLEAEEAPASALHLRYPVPEGVDPDELRYHALIEGKWTVGLPASSVDGTEVVFVISPDAGAWALSDGSSSARLPAPPASEAVHMGGVSTIGGYVVRRLVGNPTYLPPGGAEAVEASVGEVIPEGSTISTNSTSTLTLDAPDGSQTSYAADTQARQVSCLDPQDPTILGQLKGALMNWSRKDQERTGSSQVGTKGVVIGVRGTVFGASIVNGDLQIEVAEGEVELRIGDETLVVEAGQVLDCPGCLPDEELALCPTCDWLCNEDNTGVIDPFGSSQSCAADEVCFTSDFSRAYCGPSDVDDVSAFDGAYFGSFELFGRIETEIGDETYVLTETCVGTVEFRFGASTTDERPVEEGTASMVCTCSGCFGRDPTAAEVPVGGTYNPIAGTVDGWATFPGAMVYWQGNLIQEAYARHVDAIPTSIDLPDYYEITGGSVKASRVGP